MQHIVARTIHAELRRGLSEAPVVALLGSRQCGKSTLAREVLRSWPESRLLDLEMPSDHAKLDDPEEYFRATEGCLVCIDEIQRAPDLFAVMRAVVDQRGTNGQFLVLGSASRDLIRQSSETLAGRIAYLELTPFMPDELSSDTDTMMKLWTRGGYPRSFLAASAEASVRWRLNFVRTFLERDVPRLAPGLSIETVDRLWRMCAHEHGQTANWSKLASALGVTDKTVRSYTNVLSGAFMVRLLPPYFANVKKRLVKSPKLYVRDTGLLHLLLSVGSYEDLLGHPVYGRSWESFVLEAILSRISPMVEAFFYRTSAHAEIDLVLTKGRHVAAIECKASSAPQVRAGFHHAADDIGADVRVVVAPRAETYPLGKGVVVTSLFQLLTSDMLAPFVMPRDEHS